MHSRTFRIPRVLLESTLLILLIFIPSKVISQTTFEENGIVYYEDTDNPSKLEVIVMQKKSPKLYPGQSAYSGDIIIPATVEHDLDTYEVVGLGKFAFMNCDITSLDIKAPITEIDHNVIYSNSLKRLILPNTIKHISGVQTQNLEEIKFGDNLEEINLLTIGLVKSLEFPNSLRCINGIHLHNPNHPLESPYVIKDFKMGNKIEKIHGMNLSFDINKLTIPLCCKEITGSFYKLPTLKELKIEPGICKIESSFEEIPEIKELNIPGTCEKIERSFYSLPSLEKIKLEEGVKFINSSFLKLGNLETLIIPETVLIIDRSFRNFDSLKILKIPDSVEKIISSFNGFKNIEKIYFGKGWSDLDRERISLLNLKEGELREIHCPWENAPSFYDNPSNALRSGTATLKIFVPAGKAQGYLESWHLIGVKGAKIIEE